MSDLLVPWACGALCKNFGLELAQLPQKREKNDDSQKIIALFFEGAFKKRLCFFCGCDVVRTSGLVGE